MGNTPTSPKKANEQRSPSTKLDLLPLKERFNQLARPPAGDGEDLAPGKRERFVLLEDCSELVGPRAVQVAERLYRVLDAGGDGRLDFEEFSSAACLLESSPDDDKLTLLFKMYGDSTRGGLVGRKGIQAFILDILAASPPPFAPVEHQRQAGDRGETNGVGLDQPPAGHARLNSSARDSFSAGKMREQAAHAGTPDFEMELEHVLSRMASAVLGEVMRLSPLRMPDVGFVLRQGERELVHDASFYGHSRISCSMPVHHVDVDLNP
ncbi:unnamed protein product [Ascophyllum nodosum]